MLTPVEDKIILEKTGTTETNVGGIYVPETSRKNNAIGKVIAVGPGRTTDAGVLLPMFVKVGDIVIHSALAGLIVTDSDNKDYLIIRQAEVLAIKS